MSYASACLLFAVALLAVAVFAVWTGLRPVSPFGLSPQMGTPWVVRCARCRSLHYADLYGRPMPHYPPGSTQELCEPRRIH